MPQPKRRHSKSRSRKRNSHNTIKPRQLAKCPQCGTMAPTHVICPTCGYYQGRTLVEESEE
ncbi:MAG: 50S ribosomal protein L32 [Planctomycetaceae bacterium]|nr:50S ribosomal protein L32 [Planctomycetaceae bacterium]